MQDQSLQKLIEKVEDHREEICQLEEEKCLILKKLIKLLETGNLEEVREQWSGLHLELKEIDNRTRASFQQIEAEIEQLAEAKVTAPNPL
ncbi:MAG TPA: hypothetical protein VH186_12320 [Chloroflexia bacterium]|nr:hypothetical protein [Chloroflexia bacterium]